MKQVARNVTGWENGLDNAYLRTSHGNVYITAPRSTAADLELKADRVRIADTGSKLPESSRRAGMACGCWLILMGVFGKIAGVITSIPDCV